MNVCVPKTWPNDSSCAVSITVDVDGEAGVLGMGKEYERRLTSISEGRYGVVAGLPRVREMLQRLSIPATFFVPGYVAETHRDLIRQLLRDGHEVAHHGYMHLRNDKASPEEQATEITRGLDALHNAGAGEVSGYRSPAWEMTPETLDLLVQYNFKYDSSCMGDDRPYVEAHNGSSIIEIPVHWSLDDYPRYGWNIDSGGNMQSPCVVYKDWIRDFELAKQDQRHITFTIHPAFTGRPARCDSFRRLLSEIKSYSPWFATLAEVSNLVSGPPT